MPALSVIVFLIIERSEFSLLLRRYVTKGNDAKNPAILSFSVVTKRSQLKTFARKFSNIDFFLKILTLKDDELAGSEM